MEYHLFFYYLVIFIWVKLYHMLSFMFFSFWLFLVMIIFIHQIYYSFYNFEVDRKILVVVVELSSFCLLLNLFLDYLMIIKLM